MSSTPLALVLALLVLSCGARLTLSQGMPGVAVPIRDAPACRLYDHDGGGR